MLLPNNEWVVTGFAYGIDEPEMTYRDYHYRLTPNYHTINGKNYIELEVRQRDRYGSTPTSAWTNWTPSFFYLAEDIPNKKVYAYYIDSQYHEQGEYLIYDFNLEIGDLMDFSGFVDGYNNETLQIVDITQEYVFGLKDVKTYHFNKSFQYPILMFEGIGSNMGLVFKSFSYDAGLELTDFGVNLQFSLDELDAKRTRIYPNPFSNHIYIESSKPILIIQVYDLNGKLLISTSDQNQINERITNLNSGYYLLKIKYKNHTSESFKLVKR